MASYQKIRIKTYGPIEKTEGDDTTILWVLSVIGEVYKTVLKNQLVMTRSQFNAAVKRLEKLDLISVTN